MNEEKWQKYELQIKKKGFRKSKLEKKLIEKHNVSIQLKKKKQVEYKNMMNVIIRAK